MGSENCRIKVGDSYDQFSNLFEKENRKKTSSHLSIKLSPKKVREEFLIVYEIEGCQKAVNFLTNHYRVRRMRIVLNGKKVRKEWVAWYCENQACFKKNGLRKRIVLHELYHHLVEARSLEMPLRTEEKEANDYARRFLRN